MQIVKHEFLSLLHADLLRQRRLLSGDMKLEVGRKIWLGILAPRFVPVLLYRLAHQFQVKGLGFLAKACSLFNFLLFGIEIANNCQIGPGVFFPHTHGTVIGAISIGSNAVIYQGVTLGAKDLDFTYDESHRPSIGDNVLIGAGAKVLGGIRVGNNVCIAANAVVLQNLGDDVIAVGIPARVVREGGNRA